MTAPTTRKAHKIKPVRITARNFKNWHGVRFSSLTEHSHSVIFCMVSTEYQLYFTNSFLVLTKGLE